MSTFARFPARLQDAIVSRLGWTALRPVQDLAGEAILDGNNTVVLAPTAGGKTEAAVFPLLASLIDHPAEGLAALYIAPIKALLNNQEERLGTYTEMVGLRRFVWHGDVPDAARRAFLEEPTELLLTTPESLEVMLISPRVPAAKLFAGLRYVIIDEVHALAGTDRGAHLASVLERLARFTPHDVQRVGLSATVGNPEAILAWLRGSSQRPGVVIDPPHARIRRQIQVSMHETVIDLAEEAAHLAEGKKSLFFCQSRALTEKVADRMRGGGVDVFVHHGSLAAEERHAAEERFHHGEAACIVCTSTLELGIDVGDLDRVLQADAPATVSSFMQRMGRTGRRAGQVANTSFLCQDLDAALLATALIELSREGWVEPVALQDRCWPVLVHQLLALTLQHGAISEERCWEQLSLVPDFGGIRREEYEALVEHMIREDYLFEAGGLLSMGQQAERVFGRKNFMEIYAVFSSPVLYRVFTKNGQEIGSIEQGFVDRLVEGLSSFLLGGRAWTVAVVNHADRIVRVEAAPRGREPTWSGYLPLLLSFEVCRRIRRVLVEGGEFPYLHPSVHEPLAERQRDLALTLGRPDPVVQYDGPVAHWWTCAGGRINHTLKVGLELVGGWKVIADNFQVRITGDGVVPEAVGVAIGRLGARQFWEDPATWTALLARLPEYRLSKFQRALPASLAREVVAAYLLDPEGARGFAAGTIGER